jgi:hypothetical protein
VTAPNTQPDCDCGHASDRHDYNAVTGMRPCDDCGCPTWEPKREAPAPGETGGAHHFDGAPVCTHPDCYALEGQPSAARCCPLGYFEAKREDAPAYEVADAEGEPIGTRRAEDPEVASLRAQLAAVTEERDVLVLRLAAIVYVCAACGAIVDAARVGPSKLARPHLALDGECAGCTIYCPRVVRVGGAA